MALSHVSALTFIEYAISLGKHNEPHHPAERVVSNGTCRRLDALEKEGSSFDDLIADGEGHAQ